MVSENKICPAHDVVCVGNITFDSLLYVDCLPALDDVSYVNNSTLCMGGRGAIPAMIASALGAHTALCTVIGKNPPAKILEPLQHTGVDLSGITQADSGEGAFEVIVAIGRKEQNCISFFIPKDIPIVATDIHKRLASSAKIVYITTHKRSFNREIMLSLKGHQEHVVHNISPYLFTDETYRNLALTSSSILLGNQAEVIQFYKDLGFDKSTVFNNYPNLHAVVVTLGSDGVEVSFSNGSSHQIPARSTDVLTPVGAGDSFAGGLLYALSKGCDLLQAVQLGVITASESLSAKTSYPDCDSLRKRISRQLRGPMP